MQDETVATSADEQSVAVPVKKQRHFLAVFFFSFMWGIFGIDRFYMGKYVSGILKLVTVGGFGIWALVDLSVVMSGGMRDSSGNEMLEYERYRKFARRTVTWFSVITGLILTVACYIAYVQLMPLLQGGSIQELLKNFITGSEQIDPSILQNL
jgi:hypothetical protein